MKKVDADDVTIISVTYNSAHCLPALSEALKPLKNVIIVDNASDDDIEVQLQIALPNATLIRNAKNLGSALPTTVPWRRSPRPMPCCSTQTVCPRPLL
jgi:N-acetylglucosaminyl-diphospho-decaprenol L-rhamnosyltransferase